MSTTMTHETIDRVRRGLGTVLLWFAGALLVLMTLLVLYQVFTRYVLNSPVAFTEELVRYALIWTTFASASYAFLHRHHMALTVVRDKLPPRARHGFLLGADALVLLFALLVLGIGGAMLAYTSRNDVSALLGISRGAVYLIAPLTGLAITVAQVLNIWEDLTGDPAADTEGTD